MTSLSQRDITPFYLSTNIPVQPHYPEANLNGDAALTWKMDMTCGTKACQTDERSLKNVEENNSRDKENDEQYVDWICSGFSLIRRDRPELVIANTATTHHNAQENPQLDGLTHHTSTLDVPAGSHQSRHLPLPTGAGNHPNSACNIDADRVPPLQRQDVPAGPIRQQVSSRIRRQALQRMYDKPGNKAPVAYEPDLPRLQELSRLRGGQDFAIAWIPKAFTKGVKANALRRTLTEDEISAVDHDHGFRLSRAYDGFLEKVEDRFECGLCAEEKRANWKNKKDAIRHFQKFHFGIGQTCGTW